MCTSPKSVYRKRKDGSVKIITVPCGTCEECRVKKQSEFAAVSVLEAETVNNLCFLTLTYDSEHLPVAIVDSTDPDLRIIGFYRGESCRDWQIDEWNNVGCKTLNDENKFMVTPSLYREDIKLFLKRYRQGYFRRHGKRCDLRYSVFGEYGEEKHRPHAHMLVYGIDNVEQDYLSKCWQNGNVFIENVSHFNSDGSDAFAKVSRYVSKYISKGEHLPDFVKNGFAQKPRMQSSIRLGVRNFPLAKYRNFI